MPVYLDNNASTQLDPRVFEAMQPYMQDIYGNGSSLHRYGRLARSGIEQARDQLAQAVQAHPDQVIFTVVGQRHLGKDINSNDPFSIYTLISFSLFPGNSSVL